MCDSIVEHCVCASKVVEPVRLLSVVTVSNSVVVDATKICQLIKITGEIIFPFIHLKHFCFSFHTKSQMACHRRKLRELTSKSHLQLEADRGNRSS